MPPSPCKIGLIQVLTKNNSNNYSVFSFQLNCRSSNEQQTMFQNNNNLFFVYRPLNEVLYEPHVVANADESEDDAAKALISYESEDEITETSDNESNKYVFLLGLSDKLYFINFRTTTTTTTKKSKRGLLFFFPFCAKFT